MDLRQQHNVQENNPAPVPQQQYHPTPTAHHNQQWWWPSMGSKVLVGMLITAAIIVLIVFAVGTFSRQSHPLTNLVDNDGWQAVFLSNGQVYFGKITSINGQMLILEDIYYLQVDQQIQPGEEESVQNQEPSLSLAKLGSELHGPQDQMFISMNEVIFWENLRDKENSRVVEAIEEFKNNNGELPSGQAQPQQSGEGTIENTPDPEETPGSIEP